MTPKLRGILSVGVLILTLAILAWGLREVFTREVPGGNDLYPRWAAGCAWLSQGIDPYSQEATLSVQQGIYGRPALPSEDQVAFAYPIFVMAAVWPLCLTPDFATAHAATMAALMAGVIGSAILARRVSGWKVGGWLWPWILFWIVISYPSARSILLGQLA
ncbi:MAG TPA: hypothetical protein VLA15_02585, partial [Desulfurivibrionaceae bacterium]|nr:hypothetical protein [Desulfurivibrionaceae bacterium]